jgi:hypothetical protein
MSDGDFKKYDSNHTLECRNVRLTEDAKVIKAGFTKVKFVLSSAGESDDDMWIEAIPSEGAAELAGYLKKGDVLSTTGFLTMQHWGDNNNEQFTLKFAKLHYPLTLLQALRERQEAGKSAGKKSAAKSAKKPVKPPIDLDDEDDATGDIE